MEKLKRSCQRIREPRLLSAMAIEKLLFLNWKVLPTVLAPIYETETGHASIPTSYAKQIGAVA